MLGNNHIGEVEFLNSLWDVFLVHLCLFVFFQREKEEELFEDNGNDFYQVIIMEIEGTKFLVL